jgi:hypothetical protein
MDKKQFCAALAVAGCLAAPALAWAQARVVTPAPRAARPAPPSDGLRRDGDGAPETQWEPTPPPADPRDLNGLWEVPRPATALRTLDNQAPPFTPEEAKDTQRHVDAEKAGEPIADASTYCFPHGVPRVTNAPFPIRFAYTPGLIVMLYEVNHNVRYVHMDGKPAPANTPYTFLGYSRGHWDGNTLVVETDHLNNRTLLDSHTSHGAKLKVTERFTKVKANLGHTDLEVIETIDDPEHFTKPFSMKRNFAFRSDLERDAGWGGLTEYACEENNRNIPDAFGISTAK